jgi:hypothetical protein
MPGVVPLNKEGIWEEESLFWRISGRIRTNWIPTSDIPSPAHLVAADQAITYLYRTKTDAIEYAVLPSAGEKQIFFCASNAAFADDPQTRRSTGGFLYKLFGGPTDCHSGKQKTVTTSSTGGGGC